MPKKKYQIITNYLSSNFPDSVIEQVEDFDRCAQTFKITTTEGSLLLKISDEFIADSASDELENALDNFEIAARLAENPDSGVLLTQSGLEIFNRD